MDWNENKSVRLSQACVVLFGDGSVRRISAKLPAATVRALFTRAGGEAIGNLEQ